MYTLNCRGKIVTLEKPAVMGILNITPDSFFGDSRVQSLQQVVDRAGLMLQQGALILDLGGQSTRPGAEEVGPAAETDRVVPAIEAVHSAFPEALISIDTFHASVADAALAAGAHLVNDVSGGLLDDAMLPTVARWHVPYVCMHMRGRPATMQGLAQYTDVVVDLIDYFAERLAACRQAGITDVIIDPGFGFAKTTDQNFELLRRLRALQVLNCPLLAGLSRKRTIYQTLGTTAEHALNGTTVLNTVALLQGASILRVHDVQEAVEAITLIAAMQQAGSQ
jgi:dihydropteroate synthase